MMIEELLQDFDRYAKESQGHLTEMLATISTGRVPSRKDVSQLDLSIASLRAKYDCIYQSASEQLSADEMPSDDAPAAAFAEAVRNSKTVRLRALMEQAKSCLQQFLSVRSLVDAYANALRPYQEQAQSVLQSLEENRNLDSEALQEAASGPQALLAAIACADKDTEEGMELCDRVAAFYPGRIYGGVVANKYYLEKKADTQPEPAAAECPAEPAVSAEIEPESVFTSAKPPVQEAEPVPIAAEPEPDAAVSDDAAEPDAEPDSPVDYSEFTEQLHAANCFIESDDALGTWECEKSPNESKKITASIFCKEMRSPLFPVERFIIRGLSRRNFISVQYLTKALELSEKNVRSCLAYLVNRGFLYHYSMTPGGEFYCASVRLQKALTYQEACKLMDAKQHKLKEWGETVEDAATSIAARVALSHLFAEAAAGIFARGAKSYSDDTWVMTNAFCFYVYNSDDSSDGECCAGAFWKSDAECAETADMIREMFSRNGKPRTFCFAAWDLARAKNIVDCLPAALGDEMPECPIRLYVLSENAYYSYPDLTPVDGGDLKMQHSDVEGSSEEPDTPSPAAEPDPAEELTASAAETAADIPEKPVLPETEIVSLEREVTPDEPAEPVQAPDAAPSAVPAANTVPPCEETDMLHRMVNAAAAPTDDEFYDLINLILEEKAGTAFQEDSAIAQALLLAKAAGYAAGNVKCRALYRQLSYAAKSPLTDLAYTSENLSDAFGVPFSDTLLLSAYLFALLIPGMAYDYSLKAQADEFLRDYDSYFPKLAVIKPLYAKLRTVQDVVPSGFSGSVLARLGNNSEQEAYIRLLQTQAGNLLQYSAPKARMKALPVLYSSCFGKSGDLYQCLEYVANNDLSGTELVSIVLSEFCDETAGTLTISSQKVEAFLDRKWYEVNGHVSAYVLEYAARQQALKQIYSRLQVIRDWSEHVSILPGGKYDISRLKTLKQEITDLAGQAISAVAGEQIEHKSVMLRALKEIRHYLNTPTGTGTRLFSELVWTGVITLDDAWLPVLREETDSVKYYEPWRRVLRHMLSPVRSLEGAKHEILDGTVSSDLFDNLHQLELIGTLTGESLESSVAQIETARQSAADASKDFDDALELAFTYNRITETEKENLAAMKRQHEHALMSRMDFGVWRQFLKALYRRIEELTAERKTELQGMLDMRLAMDTGKNSPILAAAQTLLNEDLNFAVTEEYINRFDNGEEDFSADLQAVLHEADHFAEFISDSVYRPIYDECFRRKDGSFYHVAKDYLPRHFPKDWTARLKEDSLRFVGGGDIRSEKYWPARKDRTTEQQIADLFNWLGMTVKRAEKCSRTEEMFRIEVVPSPRSMADYRHPISAFGTQAKRQMNVIVLHGNIPAKQLVDKVTGLGLGGMSIVILNYPISLAVRRQIAEEFHKTSGQNPFILIDQVLAIYLALHQVTERLPVLLKCTLPFTTYQPFVRDGGSTADEMFFGRSKELADILNPNGACIVYGGRQLGKTALLERAESLFCKPENRAFAVYSNILNCVTEIDLVQKITEDIRKKTALELGACDSIRGLCDEIEQLFRSGKAEALLLLLDETDKFLGAIADQDYAPLQPLIDLKRSTKNAFKFVLAGLHNVCRAKNATERNGVFGQLGTPLCVKPLSPTDALQLLSRPLKYLGFQIDRYPHLETILTNTNYYPGILQFFGYMLVETLSTHYGKYYRAVDGNPPYTLQDDQLGAVMNSADLNRSIRDKFRWSLELDPRYFMIARCIAVLYYLSDEETNTWLGFSIGQIMEIAQSYDIHCLSAERENDYRNLLDEMVEMGILSKPDAQKTLYRLRRSSFINIIGSDFDAVDADITKNNQEAAS